MKLRWVLDSSSKDLDLFDGAQDRSLVGFFADVNNSVGYEWWRVGAKDNPTIFLNMTLEEAKTVAEAIIYLEG